MNENLNWHTSSYSGGNANACVEVAETPQTVKVRDTKNRTLGHLEFTPQAWASFVAELKKERL